MTQRGLFIKKPVERDLHQHNGLAKTLTAFSLTTMGIGAIVGSGIFITPGIIAAKYAGPGVMFSFVIAVIVCALAALCYSEFSSTIPLAGSAYTYVYAVFGEFVAWVLGWALISEYLFAVSSVAVSWSSYFQNLLAGLGVQLPPFWRAAAGTVGTRGAGVDIIALVITLIVAALLSQGIRESARVNNVMVIVKILVILLFIGIAVFYVQPQNYRPLLPYGTGGVMKGAAVAFYAYIGFDAVSTASEEVQNPKRNMPIGIIASLLVAAVLYIGLSAVLVGVVPYPKLNVADPVALALNLIHQNWAAGVVSLGAIVGMTTVLIVMSYGGTRLLFAISRDGLLPKALMDVSPKTQVPVKNTWIFGGIASIFSAFIPIDKIAELVNIGTLSAFAMVSLGIVFLRRDDRFKDLDTAFKVPGYPVLPIVSFLACLYLMTQLQAFTWAVLLAVGFMVIQVACDLSLPTLTSDIIDKGIANNDIAYIWRTGGQMLLLSLIGVLGAAGNVYFAATQSQKMGQRIRSALFKKVTFSSTEEFETVGNASLITRTTNDVVQIQNVMVQMLRMMLMAPIMLVGAGILAYLKSPRLTIVFLVALPVLAAFTGLIMVFAVPLFKSLQKKIDRINLIFREGLTGVRVIRSFNQDQFEQDRFEGANQDYTQTGIKVFMIVSLMFPVITLIISGTNVGIVWYGGQLIAHQAMQVGNLVAFMTYATQILISFMMVSMVFVFVPRAQASAARINEVMDLKSKINDADQPVALAPNRSSLVFDHVDFRYTGAEKLALSDLNFSVQAGQTVAIIGGTGSGKSTLVNLIPRLFDPESGQILLDGVALPALKQADLHTAVSITQQQAVLFSGTIRSNLAYGQADATEDQMWHALAVAQAQDFVQEAGGLDARVEQNGDNFSGGQRQRLAIARTILKRASVYVFDDSFSALDFKTDALLREQLRQDEQVQNAVTVIVAQRVSTVANADLILVIDGGKVVGQGTHDELKATNHTYQEILESQLRKGDIVDA